MGTSRCRVRNAAVVSASPSRRDAQLCAQLFSDADSTLRPCFQTVDAEPYRRMCLNDLAADENSAKRTLSVCTAAAAYVSQCRLAGLDLFVPPHCVRCELENGHVMGSGEVKTFDGDAPRSADVVFVVDQKTCLKNGRLAAAAAAVDAALRDAGIGGNRFAVVAFGGRGVHRWPRVHTADGQIWSDRRGAQAALERMTNDDDDDGDAPADVLAAIRYAVDLPFRAGVSKQIILASCASDCQAGGYADALTLLIENDVKVHLLQPRNLAVKGGRNSSQELKVASLSFL